MDNRVSQKIVNQARVLKALRVYRSISRVEIARALGLDRSTITNLISALWNEGIVKTLSEGKATARGGRKPIRIGVEPTFGCVLGIDFQVNVCRTVVVDLGGSILDTGTEKISLKSGDLVTRIAKLIKQHGETVERYGVPLIGIGIGMPGIVDPRKGVVLDSKAFGLRQYELTAGLRERFDVPVLVDNDANCCAWGALETNKEERLENFLYLIMEHHASEGNHPADQELGLGLVIGGEVYYGAHCSSGELTQSMVPADSSLYRRAFLSGKNAVRSDVMDYCRELFERIAPIVSVFDPSHVFLGGEFCRHRDVVEAVLPAEGSGMSRNNVRFSEIGEHEVAFGAASMFLEKLFAVPLPHEIDGPEYLGWETVFELRRRQMPVDAVE